MKNFLNVIETLYKIKALFLRIGRALHRRTRVKTFKDLAFVAWEIPAMAFGFFLAIPLILFLYVIKPVKWVKIGRLFYFRLGDFGLSTDIFLRCRQLGIYPKDILYIFVCASYRLANRQLLRMVKRVLNVYEGTVSVAVFMGMRPLLEYTPFYQPMDQETNEYSEFKNGDRSLFFTPEEMERGQEKLAEIGINFEKDRFVCVHARDKAYTIKRDFGILTPENWSHNDFRNCDINTFQEAIEFIISKGYFVIRVGSVVNKPVSFRHSKLIDYSVSDLRSDFMDIFLVAHCKFIVGSASGIGDMATVFDVPRVGINYLPIGNTPMGKNYLYIPKKVRNTKTKEYIAFSEVFRMGQARSWDGNEINAKGFEYVDNEPRDIRLVVEEMFARIEGTLKVPVEDALLQQAYWDQFGSLIWKYPDKGVNVGMAWLRENQELYIERKTCEKE